MVFKVEWMGQIYAAKVFKIKGADAGAFNFLYETSMFSTFISDTNEEENLVKLVGLNIEYLNDDTYNGILVLEYCSNGDIDHYIKLNKNISLN